MENRPDDIVRLLNKVKDRASLFVEDNPGKAEAINKLKKEVERARTDFITANHEFFGLGEIIENRMIEIVHCLMVAKATASIFAEESPSKAEVAGKLIGELNRIHQEFLTATNYGKLSAL